MLLSDLEKRQTNLYREFRQIFLEPNFGYGMYYAEYASDYDAAKRRYGSDRDNMDFYREYITAENNLMILKLAWSDHVNPVPPALPAPSASPATPEPRPRHRWIWYVLGAIAFLLFLDAVF
jgi:hypothetical protein